MLEIKAHHKELKRAVNEVENKRSQDRSNKLWYDFRTLKKIKLLAQDKLENLQKLVWYEDPKENQTKSKGKTKCN